MLAVNGEVAQWIVAMFSVWHLRSSLCPNSEYWLKATRPSQSYRTQVLSDPGRYGLPAVFYRGWAQNGAQYTG
jgi:hypothetical protein